MVLIIKKFLELVSVHDTIRLIVDLIAQNSCQTKRKKMLLISNFKLKKNYFLTYMASWFNGFNQTLLLPSLRLFDKPAS